MKFQRQTLIYQRILSDNVYFRNVNNNAGIFDYIIGEAEEQECKEAFLAYYFLLAHGAPTEDALDRRIEEWLKADLQGRYRFRMQRRAGEARQARAVAPRRRPALGVAARRGADAARPHLGQFFPDRRDEENSRLAIFRLQRSSTVRHGRACARPSTSCFTQRTDQAIRRSSHAKQTFIYRAEWATVTGVRAEDPETEGGEETAEELQMPKIGRRAFVAGSAAAMLAKAIPASAQDYPARPITLIIPFPPGGSTTIVIRSVSDKLGEALGQQIVIDNRAGAGGTVGTRALAKSEPDGYTIGLGYTGTLAIGPNLYSNVGYDPRKDFSVDRADRHRAEHAGGASVVPGQDRCRSSSPTPRPTPARSATARPASAP